MKTLSFKVSEALDRRLSQLVKRRRVKKSVVVREALERFLDESGEARRPSLLDAVGHPQGCVKDAPPDLSSNPRHLSDFGR